MEIWGGWTGDTIFSLRTIFSLCKHETKSSVINEHNETWVNSLLSGKLKRVEGIQDSLVPSLP